MSARKRPSGWLSLPTSSNPSNKRARTPENQASSSILPPLNQSPQLTSTLTAPTAQPNRSSSKGTKTASYAILSTLKSSIKVLKGSCVAFKPLELIAGDLLGVLESIEASNNSTKGHPDLLEIATELPQWVLILSSYLSSPQSDKKLSSQLAERLATDLKEQVENMKAQEKRGAFRQWLDPRDQPEELRQSYHRIETLFRQLQADTAFNTYKIVQDQIQESRLDKMLPSHNARYDSSFALKVRRRACLQNTRATVLEDCRRWIYGASLARIYWLNGMAGTGKTTIAYTICSELERNSRLGANFFCSRAASDCQDVNKIIPTIAYQLAQQFYPFRSALCKTLGVLPNTAQRELQVQFTHLIQQPLLEMKEMLPSGVIVVIDALDECLDPEATQIILNLLFKDIAQLPIRFFLASRPEPVILNTILNRDSGFRSIFHLHNVEWQIVNGDIQTYLNVSLATVLEPPQIKQIAERAGALFIYATTIVRYIQLGRAGANQQTRIKAVLSGDAGNKATNKDREIDVLYSTILDEIMRTDLDPLEQSEIDLIKHILWAVTTAREPVTRATLAGLLMVDIEDVSAALEPLRSVLNVIESSDVVSTLHASFPEFILNPERSRQWSCRDNGFMIFRCFNTMRNQLRFNICDFETSCLLDKEVLGLEDRITNRIPPELSYACRYWSEHLGRSANCREILPRLDYLLFEQLLFWIEVLNLKGRVDWVPKVLAEANGWLANVVRTNQPPADESSIRIRSEAQNLIEFIHHVSPFARVFAEHPIHQSTPHLYLSCLPLTPRENKSWETYRAKMRGLPWIHGSSLDRWHIEVTAEVGGLGPCNKNPSPGSTITSCHVVTSAASLRGGTRISKGEQVQAHGSCSGKPLARSLCDHMHTGVVASVSFSSDCTRIVSGSWDNTIRVWNSCDGTPLTDPFQGHHDRVTSVSFSPDDARIVSGSWDQTVRVWNACNGAPSTNPFQDHLDRVTSVAFSPDGTRVVSGSWDKTVCVCNSFDDTLPADQFCGHDDTVNSVAFSPDGSWVASGSSDKTIRVWNSYDGTPLTGPFHGHSGPVMSVAFSPDGTQVVSGSSDMTVRLWDTDSGTPLSDPFQGHISEVTSVVFSPDGTEVASGSWDQTVRVWRAYDSTTFVSSLSGHTDAITSVAFSQDGARIVSGSWDKTIRTWKLDTSIHNSALPKHLDHTATSVKTTLHDKQAETPGRGDQSARTRGTLLQPGDRSLLWEIDCDGWLRDPSKNLLFWVPRPFRDAFPVPPYNKLVIKDGVIFICFDNTIWGNKWAGCYTSADTVTTMSN